MKLAWIRRKVSLYFFSSFERDSVESNSPFKVWKIVYGERGGRQTSFPLPCVRQKILTEVVFEENHVCSSAGLTQMPLALEV